METRLGQAAPLVVAMEAILAASPLVVDMEAVAEGPCVGLWLLVMPRWSLSLQASPGGLLVPVGCPVLSVCLALEGFPVLFVLSCLFSPGGLLIPPHFPREIWGGGGGSMSSGCRGQAEGTEAKAPEDHLLWPPELPAPPWPPELPAPPWPPELPAPPWSLSVCSTLEVPVLCSCPYLSWGASRAPTPPPPPPPSLMELLRLGTSLSGGGSNVSPLSCVSCVPASCVHIWFVSCPCFMSLWVKYVPAVFVSLCVNYPVYISPVFWAWFRLVYSLLPGVSVHVSLALSCPALFVKIKDYYLSLSPRLRVPVSSLVCAPWHNYKDQIPFCL